MSQTMQTVLLSLATSLFVSMVTFILGLKSGKNQADRAKLQELYKNIHRHFSELKEALADDCPKLWEHYKKNDEYLPLIKELESTGDILFIKKKIAKSSLDLEKRILIYSWNLKRHIPDLHNELVSNLDVYRDGYPFKTYNRSEDEKAHFESVNPTNCRTFSSRGYFILYNKEATKALLQKIDTSSCAVEFSLGNPMKYTFKIYPDSLNVSVEEYIEYIYERFNNNIEEFNRLCGEKDRLIEEIDKLLKKVEKRVREPIGFWETIIGAFGDMFR